MWEEIGRLRSPGSACGPKVPRPKGTDTPEVSVPSGRAFVRRARVLRDRRRPISPTAGVHHVRPSRPSQLAGMATRAETEWLSNADAWRAGTTERKNVASA